MQKIPPSKIALQPRLRVRAGREIALGPGKAELLELIRQTGSITKAAQQMGMSYMRAWTLIRIMNKTFKQPLVVAARGGTRGGGGAKLTREGLQALALYTRMTSKCVSSTRLELRRLEKLLGP